MRKPILLFLVTLLAFPCLALAEIDTDLRLKLGIAPGADSLEFGNTVGRGTGNDGTNAQVEVVLGPHRDSKVSFIIAIGSFYRRHPGEIQNLSIPIKIDYSVTGISIAPGARWKVSDAWNLEGKVEAGIGKGHVTLDSPGISWNDTGKGYYRSISLIAGCYYLFRNSASRVGFEVGLQDFKGEFNILSNSGNWSGGNVSGSDGMVNIIYGFQF